MKIIEKATSDEFKKQFDWRKNKKTISRIIKRELKRQEYIKISNFSIDCDGCCSYYISMIIGFRDRHDDNSDTVSYTNNILNNVYYTCFVNKDKYHSYIHLYTGKKCKNVGYFGKHTVFESMDRNVWDSVYDMAESLASGILTDIFTLNEQFGYKNCNENVACTNVCEEEQ